MKTFSITDVGIKRETNQDYVFSTTEPVGILPNLFLVADGMGGHNAGDYASRFAVEEFVRQIRESEQKTVISAMELAIRNTNALLMAKAQKEPAYAGMGTTFVAATILNNTMYVANVGDSRLYVAQEKELEQITQDHSLVEEMIRRGELVREEARFHPNKNVITRALGVNVDIIPDFFEVTLKPENTVLMCSDGLSNMMEDGELFSVITENASDLEKTGHELLRLANEHGGKDNITILLISGFTDSM